MKRWSQRPEGSTWGDFGEDDQVGRLNLITPQRRLTAVRTIQAGKVFVLSLPLNIPGPGLHPPFRQPPRLSWPLGQNVSLDEVFRIAGAIDIGNDDEVQLSLQYSTQWDGLSHIGAWFDVEGRGTPEKVFYNGFRGEFGPSGIVSLGIDNLAATGVQGRGVLVNLLAAFGTERRRIGFTALEAILAEQQLEVRPGDFLCIYTGYADALLERGNDPELGSLTAGFCGLDGGDERLLQWITESGIAALCADNLAVEAEPEGHRSGQAHCAPGTPFLPLHHHCLFKLGVHLGELWYLKELAEWLRSHGRSDFLLTAPPLRLPGAVASPVSPVATV